MLILASAGLIFICLFNLLFTYYSLKRTTTECFCMIAKINISETKINILETKIAEVRQKLNKLNQRMNRENN